MFPYLKKVVAGWCSVAVRDLTQEVASLRNQLSSARKNRDEWQAGCVACQSKLQVEVDLGDWKRKEIERLEAAIERQHEEYGRLLEERNDFAADKVRLERELDAVRDEYADEKHEHAKTTKQLELAGEENRLLTTIHATDVARRMKEQSLEQRTKAEAENAIQTMLATAGEQE